MPTPEEEAELAAWAASFANGKNPFADSAPAKTEPAKAPPPTEPQAGGDDAADLEAWAASFDAGAGSAPPARRAGVMRPAVAVFAVLIVSVSLWYLVGGGRATVERLLTRTASKTRLTAKESVDLVRSYRSGPQNQSVLERLDVVADRLDLHGITVTERRWDCTSESDTSTVICLLKGPGYENAFQWKVDRDSGDVSAANGPAADLDEFDAEALHGKVAMWDPQAAAGDAPRHVDAAPQRQAPSPAASPRPAAGRSAAPAPSLAPDAGDLVLVGVIATASGGKALFRTSSGQVEVALGKSVGKWTLSEINHRSNGESTVILRHADGARELRMSQRRTHGAAAPHETAPSSAPASHASPAAAPSPPAGSAAPSGEAHGAPHGGESGAPASPNPAP